MFVALAAAPFFVRQDQVRSFIEENIALPDDQKLILSENIDFGFFPYSYIETKQFSIKDQSGLEKTFKDVKLGFDFNSIFTKSLGFDFNVVYNDIPYQGNLNIVDYRQYLEQNKSPIELNIEKPVPADLTGLLSIEGDLLKFSDFVLEHKKTTAEGDVEVLTKANGQKIKGNLSVNSDNIDDLRRLALFDQYNDDFDLLSGKGNLVLSFETEGNDGYSFRRNLNTQGKIDFKDTVLYGIDLYEIVNNPKVIELTKNASKKLNLDDISSSLNIINGVIKAKDFKAVSEKLAVAATGDIDIADETILLATDINAILSSEEIELPLLIRGDIRDPKITPRIDEKMLRKVGEVLSEKGIKIKGLESGKNKEVLDETMKQIEGIGGSIGSGLKGLIGGMTDGNSE